MSASSVSARIEALSRPPVASSPLPSMTYSPRSKVRATSASARMLTTAARSLASWPSARSGCSRYSESVTTRPEHRVAEELEALVVGQSAVLVGVGAVRQGAQKQRLVDVLADHLGEVGEQGIDGPLRHRRNTLACQGCSRRRSVLVLGALSHGVVTALVGAAGRARDVRLGSRTTLGARRERGRRCLPVRATRTGVGARHLPLRDSHVSSSSLAGRPAASRAGPTIGGRTHHGGGRGRPRAGLRTRSTTRGSPAGTSA